MYYQEPNGNSNEVHKHHHCMADVVHVASKCLLNNNLYEHYDELTRARCL